MYAEFSLQIETVGREVASNATIERARGAAVLRAPLTLRSLALDGGADFWRAGDGGFQVGSGRECVEDRSRDTVVDFGGAANVDGVADNELEHGGVGELQARLGLGRTQGDFEAALSVVELALDDPAILFENRFDNGAELFLDKLVVAFWRQGDGDFVPGIFGSGQLLEKWRTGLKENGVGEHDDATGWIKLDARAGEFHQIEAHEADVDHVAGHAGDADAVADANAVAADDEEICGDREQDCLQADGDTGGDEPSKCRERTEFADKSHDEHDADEEADDEAPHQEELAATARFVNVAEDEPAP